MTDLEIISRQSAEIYDLKDKLAEETEVAKHWMDECNKRVPVTLIHSFGDIAAILADVVEVNKK